MKFRELVGRAFMQKKKKGMNVTNCFHSLWLLEKRFMF